ncbi:MAG: hypothetical protein ACO3JL_11645 [Myxococcota bacterium]
MNETKLPDVTSAKETPAAVADDIQRTRARVERTLAGLEQTLHPVELLERAKGGFEQLWRRGPLTPVRDAVTSHPFAFGLIGAGVALWTLDGLRQRRSLSESSGPRNTPRAAEHQGRATSTPPDEPSYAGDFGLFSKATEAQQRAVPSSNGHTPRRGTAKMTRWAKERAEGLARGARRRAEDAKAQAKGLSQRTSSWTQSVWHQMSERWSDARSALRARFEAHPLAFAAGAMVSGVTLGLLLRPTRREDRLLGPQRDAVMQRVFEGTAAEATTPRSSAASEP